MNPQDILNIISRVGDGQNRQQERNSNPEIFSAVCAIAGGVLGGPAGMAIAGLAGTALSTVFTQSPRNPRNHQNPRNYQNPRNHQNPPSLSRSRLSDIIENQMNDEQRRKLAQIVRQIMRENPNSNSNLESERNILENENMSNTLVSQVLNVAQNMGQNSGRPSNSNRFNYRERLGSNSRPQSGRSCGGGGCGCRRGSSS